MKSFLMLAIPGKHQPNALHEFMSPLHTKVKAHTSKYNRSSLEYIVFPFCLIVSRTNQYWAVCVSWSRKQLDIWGSPNSHLAGHQSLTRQNHSTLTSSIRRNDVHVWQL